MSVPIYNPAVIFKTPIRRNETKLFSFLFSYFIVVSEKKIKHCILWELKKKPDRWNNKKGELNETTKKQRRGYVYYIIINMTPFYEK